MQNRNLTWKLLSVLLVSLPYIQSHMLHYMHLKKFITAVAFARALGKRPTVLPIPIPIPIPIAQNEVIKLPMGGNTAKTTILDGSKGSSQADAIAQLLGGGSPTFAGSNPFGYALPSTSSHPSVINLSQLLGGSTYAASNKFGYALPSSNSVVNLSQLLGGSSNKFGYALPSSSSHHHHPSVVNLSQLKGSDSNVIGTLASALGDGGGQTRVLIVGGGGQDNLAANPTVIHLNGVPGGVVSHSNPMGGLNSGGLNDLLGLGGGTGFGDLGGSGSSSSSVFQSPRHVHSNGKTGGKIRVAHRGNGHSPKNGGNSKACGQCRQPMNDGQRPTRDDFRNAPLSVKFTYRP